MMSQTSYLAGENKRVLASRIIGFPSLSTILINIALLYAGVSYFTQGSDCRFNLIPLYLIISNSALLATSLFKILSLSDTLSAMRDGHMVGVFVGVANLTILCWGTYVVFGYGKFDKWDMEEDNPSYCGHAPVIVATANLIITWIIIPAFLCVECSGIFEHLTRRSGDSKDNRKMPPRTASRKNFNHGGNLNSIA